MQQLTEIVEFAYFMWEFEEDDDDMIWYCTRCDVESEVEDFICNCTDDDDDGEPIPEEELLAA